MDGVTFSKDDPEDPNKKILAFKTQDLSPRALSMMCFASIADKFRTIGLTPVIIDMIKGIFDLSIVDQKLLAAVTKKVYDEGLYDRQTDFYYIIDNPNIHDDNNNLILSLITYEVGSKKNPIVLSTIIQEVTDGNGSLKATREKLLNAYLEKENSEKVEDEDEDDEEYFAPLLESREDEEKEN